MRLVALNIMTIFSMNATISLFHCAAITMILAIFHFNESIKNKFTFTGYNCYVKNYDTILYVKWYKRLYDFGWITDFKGMF